ncbi:MAG TPA: YdbL family protein [Candidatus Binatia bacterium]
MLKKFLVSLAFFLTACVTVNIYFPAAAVQRAADTIVNETWGSGGGSGNEAPRPGPKQAPGDRGSIAGRILVSIVLPNEAFAQEPDINISNPAIRALKDAIKARSESLKPYLDRGNVGINRDGLLAVRTTDGPNLKERAEVQQLVEAENRDRESLYGELAKANNIPREKVADIKRIFARSWIEQARPGWWIQDAQGNWAKK